MTATKISLILILILCVTILSSALYCQDDGMKKAAQKRMEEWYKVFSEDQIKQLGFESKAEFKASVLGQPFKLYTISPSDIMSYKEEMAEIGSLVAETGFTIFPVHSGGSVKALLWMVKNEDQWQVAKIGSSSLAHSIAKNTRIIEEKKFEKGLEGAAPAKLIRIYQLHLDFQFVKADKMEYLLPVQSIPEMKIESGKFYTPRDMLPQWKELLKQKMAPDRETQKNIEG